MSRSLSDLAGDFIRERLQDHTTVSRHASQRAKLVHRMTAPRSRRMAPMVLSLAGAMLVACTVAVVIALRSSEQALTFDLESPAASYQVGTYFSPAGDQPLVLRFSEGSRVSLQPRSRARVTAVSHRGATLSLEEGGVNLDITPIPGGQWNVVAGPFVVQVRGTAFVLSWSAQLGRFELQMQRGKVWVTGPGLESGVELEGTQHLVTHLSSDALAEPSTKPEPSASPPAVFPTPGRGDDSPDPGGAPPKNGGPTARDRPLPWSTLAAKGQYDEILAQADRRGVDRLLSTGSLDELWALADAARVRGQSGTARRALVTIRQRFAGTTQAATAAFLIGRMSESSPAAAVSWHETYLAEAPSGRFAPEASGRRMVALRRSGNQAAARQAASAYLKSFPKGPYAGVAREMVQ